MSSNPGDSAAGGGERPASMHGAELASDAARSSEEALGMTVRQLGECDEPFGPLAVRRYLKEDGRALLLYSRRGGQRG